MLKRFKDSMTLFQWAEILTIIGFTLYFALTDTADPLWYILLDAAAAVCGVVCVVLCAGGRKSQYYWGLMNVLAYIVVAFRSRYYGEVMLNALYYLPSQFIGLRGWSRHERAEDGRVTGKRMDGKGLLLWMGGSAAAVLLYAWILKALGGEAPLLDSVSTVLSVAANLLMLMRYREQWLLWIVVDGVTVAMWALAGDPVMTVMWSVYLINAVYGYFVWTRLSREENAA